jgi:soluble lytic murein transglycosylase-like protein
MGETMLALINAAADKWKLSPRLVNAIVQAESDGNPFAIRYEPGIKAKYIQSPKKHRPMGCSLATEYRLQMFSFGLMQVLGFNIRAMGYGGWLTEYVDPEKGLEVGCNHLAGLLRRWPKVEDAVSAYNQGSPRKDDLGNYENQEYVDRVMALVRR